MMPQRATTAIQTLRIYSMPHATEMAKAHMQATDIDWWVALLLSPDDEVLDFYELYRGRECPLLSDWPTEDSLRRRVPVGPTVM